MSAPHPQPAAIEAKARALGQSLPALLVQADLLAASILAGEHGRKRAGNGSEFWQYRAAALGDSARSIDWRRSARSDQLYVKEQEWQAAQSLTIWLDQGASMGFASQSQTGDKADRARLLALALAVLALRGGERVALLGQSAKAGRGQIATIAGGLFDPAKPEYDRPDPMLLPQHGWVICLSDFMGPLQGYSDFLSAASGKGLRGILMQVLDPAEESFPYRGRILFQSMTKNLSHKTDEAAQLRKAYQERLAERKAALAQMARHAGWRYQSHVTQASAQSALLWAYHAMGAAR